VERAKGKGKGKERGKEKLRRKETKSPKKQHHQSQLPPLVNLLQQL
jgi:hypothetical protein